MKKLAVVLSHPVQYYSPIFELLNSRKVVKVKVFYTHEPKSFEYDKGFGQNVEWDVPLLKGYDYEFVSNNGNYKRGFFDVKNPSLLSSINSWNPDAILVFGWNYYSHLKAMKFFHGKIPVLFRGDSTLLDESKGLKKYLRRWFLTYVYSKVDKALYVGEANKKYFEIHGLNSSKLVFAPHAIDNNRFGAFLGSEKLTLIRDKFNIPHSSIVVLFVGKFQSKKNPELLINAFSQLESQNAHLILVGNGEQDMKLKKTAEKNPNIHFAGFLNQSELPLYYAASDIFCLPSKGPGETWGLAINEAMAAGNAIIASNKCGCVYNLVENNQNGFIFDSDNLHDLKVKLERLISNRDVINKFSLKSLEKIKSYSFENIVVAIENILTK